MIIIIIIMIAVIGLQLFQFNRTGVLDPSKGSAHLDRSWNNNENNNNNDNDNDSR